MMPTAGTVPRAASLPLNLVARIVSYLDDVGDIARVVRTSRLLCYMALPQLYAKVSLHSYPDIRYINGRPEGFGSGSPFTMALNGLVTKSHASLVREFRIWGKWNEVGTEDFAKGRVPDNSMMLNILLRAAVDKMTKMGSFSWELDCKPLKTLYQGLASHTNLASLTIKFPNSRLPRPSVIIPPMLNLRVFLAIDVDPLCYPDDISLLLLHSKKLEDVRIHFSPRMRQEAESSLSLETYFGRCFKAGYRLPVRHFAMQNFYGSHVQSMEELLDNEKCKSVTFIDTFGGSHGGSKNVFLDDSWKAIPVDKWSNFRKVRCNEQAMEHVRMISGSTGLVEMYFIGTRPPRPVTTPVLNDAPASPAESPPEHDVTVLGKEYIFALTRNHGSTLKILLLSDLWALTQDDICDIVRFCPNLEQLGMAINSANHDALCLLIPFLPRLKSLRVLHNDWLLEHLRTYSHEERIYGMGRETWSAGAMQLKWIGIGEHVYRFGKTCELKNADGTREMYRDVQGGSLDEVKDIEIWALDRPDIFVDPGPPFPLGE